MHAMRELKRGYIDTPGGQMHFHYRSGSGAPIVFLHQTAQSAKTYDPLFRVLDLPNSLIAFDTPGFGGSYDVEGWPTMADYADAILSAIDALPASRFHLYGHHTGASLAIEIAAQVPPRVASLMLSGPVFMTTAEQAAFQVGYREPIMPQRDGGHLLRNWGYAAGNNRDCDLALLQEVTADLLRAWRSRPQSYMAVAGHDTAGRAAQVAAPTLLMTTPGDFFRSSFDRAVAVFPGAAVAETGGDNFPTAIDPAGVARVIERFMGALQ
jgi:pimeloyl-ACP methyl ester carboxylesterase